MNYINGSIFLRNNTKQVYKYKFKNPSINLKVYIVRMLYTNFYSQLAIYVHTYVLYGHPSDPVTGSILYPPISRYDS